MNLTKPKPVTEREAEGDIERAYHEIKQTLRVSGINLNFRTWAGYGRFLPMMWDGLRPNLETRAFEDAGDRIRGEAVAAASGLGRLNAFSQAKLGESQAWQIRAALDLYHYINPKLLALTSAVKLALEGHTFRPAAEGAAIERIERGIPARMYPMEMAPEEPDDQRLKDAFEDIQRTLELESINSDYRTLALWPEYLLAAWRGLKPLVSRQGCREADGGLRELSRQLATALPLPVTLTRRRVEELGEDTDEIVKKTESFERLLPGLILNIALFQLDDRPPQQLAGSPFPAAPRGAIS